MRFLFLMKQRNVIIKQMFSIKIDKNNISKLCFDIVNKYMQNILDTVIKAIGTRPKNKYIVDRKSPYKNYICN